jgi:hypothetical protein
MHSTLPQFTRFTGIGPINIPDASRISNQQEIIDSLVSIIERLSKTAPPSAVNSESPHHVLSILGGRGTGKTSLLLTIIKQLRQGKNNALTLDLLQADQLRESFPVVPAIVALAENLVTSAYSREVAMDFISRHSLPLKKLAWASESPELLRALSRDTLNLSDWNTKVFELIGQPADLPGRFREWITALLEKTGKTILVVPIDDTDISVDKASEVIDAIRIFLSDPRIVTIVAADMESLERRIRNKRLASLPQVPELKSSKDDESASFLFGLSSAQYQSQEAVAEQQYVESLLVKVLPPATRHAIRPIPPADRVARQFFLPGQADFHSLHSLVRDAEIRLGASKAVLADLLLRHPDLLSANLRTFANQYAMIRGLCASAVPDAPTDLEWENHTGSRYHAPILGSRGGNAWMRITSREQFSLSRLQGDILHSILSSNEFRTLEEGVTISQRVQLRELPTIQEIASATLEAAKHTGVRSEPSGRRLIYRVLSRDVREAPASSFVDFCIDYAIDNGATIETLSQVTDISFESLVGIRYPIPYILFGELNASILAKLSPELQLSSNPRSKTVGGDLFIKFSRDQLAPTFVSDSLDIGVFAGRIPGHTRNESQRELLRFAEETEEGEKTEDRPELVGRCFLNLIGCLTLDAFLTFDAALQTVIRTSRQVQDPFFVEWSRESAWVLRVVEEFHDTLTNILTSDSVPWQKRFELLCFVADLPFEHLHNSIPNVDQSTCENLRCVCGRFLDHLTDTGLLEQRIQGSVSLGVLKVDPQSKVPLVFASSKRQFPSIAVERRTEALRKLLVTIENLKPTPNWDYRLEAPPAWMGLSEQIKESFRSKAKRRTKKDTASKSKQPK